MNFQPDYHNLVDAAYNRVPKHPVLYEHLVDCFVMEQIRSKKFSRLYDTDKVAFFRE